MKQTDHTYSSEGERLRREGKGQARNSLVAEVHTNKSLEVKKHSLHFMSSASNGLFPLDAQRHIGQ